ncbi:MAG: hypothetical protein HC840_26140 [Leptolyngbyaceae cyanobacterium RM2_2_4]|nr:hypothetical protein [Leptolyngbyaceae cyanobacterium RM2_2_4]
MTSWQFRDAQSKCKLEELGVKKTIHIISDLALEALPQFSQSESIPNKPLQIGVSVRHLSNRGSSVDIDTYPTLQKEIASTIDFLIEHYGVVAHFLPLRTFKDQYHHTDDDYVSSLGVLRHSRFSSNCVVHRYFESVEALSTRIGSLDMMIGMRLHSLILAAGAGIPVIGLEYDPKVGGFMAEINQSELAIPIREFESEKSLPKITKVLDDLPKARLSVQDGIEVYKQKRSKARESLLELFS